MVDYTLTPDDRVLRLPEVENICGIKKSTIRRHELAGTFPARIRIGSRSVGWKLSEIKQWLDNLNCMEAGV